VVRAQHDADPVAAAVKAALVAVADVVGEANTADLLGVSPATSALPVVPPPPRQAKTIRPRVGRPSGSTVIVSDQSA
jgi:hypothetical protein